MDINTALSAFYLMGSIILLGIAILVFPTLWYREEKWWKKRIKKHIYA